MHPLRLLILSWIAVLLLLRSPALAQDCTNLQNDIPGDAIAFDPWLVVNQVPYDTQLMAGETRCYQLETIGNHPAPECSFSISGEDASFFTAASFGLPFQNCPTTRLVPGLVEAHNVRFNLTADSDLPEGDYTITVTTKLSGNGVLRGTSIKETVRISNGPPFAEGLCTDFVDFTPVAILNDGLSSTRLEVSAPASSAVELALRSGIPLVIDGASGCDGAVSIPLFDDGSNGDVEAGDDIFTVDGVHWDTRFPENCLTPPSGSIQPTEIPGVTMVQVRDIVVSPPQSSQPVHILSVLDAASFSKLENVVQLSPDVRVASDVVNVRDDDQQVGGFLGQGEGPSDLRPLAQLIYEVLPDDFDFLAMVPTTQFRFCGSGTVGKHETVQRVWSGAGQPLMDDSESFGSSGALLGVNAVLAEFFPDYGLLSHEIIHLWAAKLSTNPSIASGSHWGPNTSVGGVEGGCVWIDNGDGTFTSGGTWRDSRVAADLELYLMGLVPGNEVGPILIASTNQSFCTVGTTIIGPFEQVTIADIQAANGVRTPGPIESQREFAMAYVVTSPNRFLNPLEMTLFGRVARVIDGRLPAQVAFSGVPPTPTFEELTEGRAVLSTAVPEPNARLQGLVGLLGVASLTVATRYRS